MNLRDLQAKVISGDEFDSIDKFYDVCRSFLRFLNELHPTRIISPTDHRYVFFQFGEEYGHKITRPLNTNLFIEKDRLFQTEWKTFLDLLSDLRVGKGKAPGKKKLRMFLERNGVNRVVYTIQQSIGSIGDSFENPNQSRKRVGMLFEKLVKYVIQEIGFECESRKIAIPIPNLPEVSMSYELDMVISGGKAIVASEDSLIEPNEIIGSVKTTSKDRIDKIFLDKYMMSKLLGRSIPVIAVFLHDVQRAGKRGSNFGVNGTFKSNHFKGYTYALNRLDGVYYVDPRPKMLADSSLAHEISDFGKLITRDLWELT